MRYSLRLLLLICATSPLVAAAGCISAPTSKTPSLIQSTSKSVDPLDRERRAEQVACKH